MLATVERLSTATSRRFTPSAAPSPTLRYSAPAAAPAASATSSSAPSGAVARPAAAALAVAARRARADRRRCPTCSAPAACRPGSTPSARSCPVPFSPHVNAGYTSPLEGALPDAPSARRVERRGRVRLGDDAASHAGRGLGGPIAAGRRADAPDRQDLHVCRRRHRVVAAAGGRRGWWGRGRQPAGRTDAHHDAHRAAVRARQPESVLRLGGAPLLARGAACSSPPVCSCPSPRPVCATASRRSSASTTVFSAAVFSAAVSENGSF